MLEKDAQMVIHRAGQVILREGEPVERLYCLLDGAVKMCRQISTGEQQIISLVCPGEVIGLRALMYHRVFTSSAVAVQTSRGMYLSAGSLQTVLQENPTLSLNILKFLCLEMDAVENQIAGLTRKNSPQRIAEALLLLQDKFGTDERGYLRIQLSRKDLANLTHTTIGTLSRVLAQLRREGILSGTRHIRICDAGRLRTLATTL